MNQKLSSSPTNSQKWSALNSWSFQFTEQNMKIRVTKFWPQFSKLRQKSGSPALNFQKDSINTLERMLYGRYTRRLVALALLKDQFVYHSSQQV